MTLIEMTLHTARRLGADRQGVRLRDLHESFLRQYPNATQGRTQESFGATLSYHCINMRSRFPDRQNREAPAYWMRQPYFKRVGRGFYMLLSADEIARFHECLRNRHPLVFADEFDVTDLLKGAVAIANDTRPDNDRRKPSVAPTGPSPPARDHRSRISQDDPRLLEAMSRFVSAFSDCPDISFRVEDDRSDLTIPVNLRGPQGTHYLLMAAAIDVGTNSNDIRPFLVRLHQVAPTGLFGLDQSHGDLVFKVIDECQAQRLLSGWQAKKQVPRILADVNVFVRHTAAGDLDRWARAYDSPEQIVRSLAENIHYQGKEATEARKKMWMFMRWVVRPAPDLHLWDHLSPRDLMVPVDRHVARFAEAVGIVSPVEAREPKRATVEKITAWARTLYPDDPARVDYAMFMWGRGRSNSRLPDDACYCHFEKTNGGCPLAGILPCGPRCGTTYGDNG